MSPQESRERIKEAVESRYTASVDCEHRKENTYSGSQNYGR